MKAVDHYQKAESLQRQQAALDAEQMADAIITLCHGVAHHLVCAGLEWSGINPQTYGHAHSKHPRHLKQGGAPPAVLAAWEQIERLRSRSLYGSQTTAAEVGEARNYLVTIEQWAQARRP